MVPILDKEDATDRVVDAMNRANGSKSMYKYRKNLTTPMERRLKMKMGRLMKSKIQPKGVEDETC